MSVTEGTATIPRGLPPESPVELVAVTSRLGRFAVILLAAIFASIWVGIFLIDERLLQIAAVLRLLKE